jgi:VWFA-related protein
LGFYVAISLHAQDSPTTTLKTTSTLIVLDVAVLNRAGKPVDSLDQSAFTILEDRVPKPIYSFDPPDAHRLPPAVVVKSAADLRKIGNAPVSILILDEINTPWEQIDFARREMVSYIQQQPAILPEPTLLLAAGDTHFKVLCDYTQDSARLLEAIRKHFPEFPWEMERAGSELGEGAEERMIKTLGVLEQISDSSRGTPGRKNLLWVGAGYPEIDPSTIVGMGEAHLEATIREVTARMLAAHVTLSTLDTAGVSAKMDLLPPDADTQYRMQNTNLRQMGPLTGELDFGNFALATGGHAYFGNNKITPQIATAVAEGLDYYTLSFRPSQPGADPDRYRRIRVTVNDPALQVVTRTGYYAGGPHVDAAPTPIAKTAQQLEYDLYSAGHSKLPYNGIEMAAAPAKGKPGFIIRMRANNLTYRLQPDGAQKTELTILAVFFSAKDKELASKATEIKLALANPAHLDAKSVAGYDLPTDAPAGTARARFVVRDAATGAIGTADVTFESRKAPDR